MNHNSQRKLPTIKKILPILLELVFLVVVFGIFGFVGTLTSTVVLWQKLPPIPQGTVADVMDVDIIPMGHIDQLYAMNDQKEVYLWRRDPVGNSEAWRKINSSQSSPIVEILSNNSFPTIGTYGKDLEGKIYEYNLESNSWGVTDKSQLPPQKQHHCDPWPKLPISADKVSEKFELCFLGALSEEWRYYVRDNGGSIWLWSKTNSPFTLLPGLLKGLLAGLFINILLLIFWNKHGILNLLQRGKTLNQHSVL